MEDMGMIDQHKVPAMGGPRAKSYYSKRAMFCATIAAVTLILVNIIYNIVDDDVTGPDSSTLHTCSNLPGIDTEHYRDG